ncbi:GtrA family protein [Larsenimonas rhizosphaerae]|uniref:GtrA family protein n=1 Tax=Larsenimonas rhizosphaerae TaxID=2944682 RepID=A0AA41ZIH8_9GAMM|nr:GtrA family protein [Larsenimonas rhizosphaerae]MCX2524834.1 GtrA family protein [Larsenimonas rhizosphaerae]
MIKNIRVFYEDRVPDFVTEAVCFLLVGGFLLALDSFIFYLSTNTGVSVLWGNILGRIAGAFTGFILNKIFTFSKNKNGGKILIQSLRYIFFWMVVTSISTLSLYIITNALELKAAWIAKPIIEAVLAFLSFFASKYWIYK